MCIRDRVHLYGIKIRYPQHGKDIRQLGVCRRRQNRTAKNQRTHGGTLSVSYTHLPKKQLSINESYFGFGAFLLEKLTEPISVEDLWEYYKDSYTNKKYPGNSIILYICAVINMTVFLHIKKEKAFS